MVLSGELSLEPEFINDIGAFFEAEAGPEKSVDAVLNEMREKLQQYSLAENRALNRHQTLSQQEVHLKKSLDCVVMLITKKQSEDDTIVDYALGGVLRSSAVLASTCHCTQTELGMQRTYSRKRKFPLQPGSASGSGLRLWLNMT